MLSRIRNLFATAILFSLAFATAYMPGAIAQGAVVKVTAADLTDDPMSVAAAERKTKTQKVQARIDGASAGDMVQFPAGRHEDVGQLVVTEGVTLMPDPEAAARSVIFTGEFMLFIRSSDVIVEGLVLEDVRVPDKVVIRPPKADGTEAVEWYFKGVTLESFLLARKAAEAAGEESSDALDYSGYNGGASRANLDPYVVLPSVGHNQERRSIYNFHPWVVDSEGFFIKVQVALPGVPGVRITRGSGNKWDLGGRWDEKDTKDLLATILVDATIPDAYSDGTTYPPYNGTDDRMCPDSDEDALINGVVIRNNVIDGTEVIGIGVNSKSIGAWPSSNACPAEVDIIGNTIRNTGLSKNELAMKANYVEDNIGRILTDDDGNRIEEVNSEEPAIRSHQARKLKIEENTIEGATFNLVMIQNTPQGGTVSVKNNMIRSGTPHSKIEKAQMEIRDIGANDGEADITVMGNKFLGGPGDNAYLTTLWWATSRFRWCPEISSGEAAMSTAAGRAKVERLLKPRLWRSYVPNFPFPGTVEVPFSLPYSVTELKRGSGYTVGHYDIVRYNNCYHTARILVWDQKGVKIVDNDLGYGEEGRLKNGIVLRGAGITLAEFEGNNIDNYEDGSILSWSGAEGTTLSAAGNYLGTTFPAGTVSSNVNTEGALDEPVARDGSPPGPREMVPPALPSEGGATISSTTITLAYDEALDTESVPAVAAFTVTQTASGGLSGSITVSSVAVAGMSVTLTLAEAPGSGNSVTVSYDPTKAGSGEGIGPIQDAAGNAAAAIDSRMVAAAAPMEPEEPMTGGPMTGEPMTGGGTAAAAGDGGCALASGGKGGIDLGVLLPLMTLAALSFGLRRGSKESVAIR